MDFKFSIRQLLIATFLFSFFACCIAGANRGSVSGFAVAWGFFFAIVPVVSLVAVYLFASALLLVSGSYDATPPELMSSHSPDVVDDPLASKSSGEEGADE